MALPGWIGKILFGFFGSMLGKIMGYFKRKKELKDAEVQGKVIGKAEGVSQARNEDYIKQVEQIEKDNRPVTVEQVNDQIKSKKERMQ